jgi:hypothetical protein
VSARCGAAPLGFTGAGFSPCRHPRNAPRPPQNSLDKVVTYVVTFLVIIARQPACRQPRAASSAPAPASPLFATLTKRPQLAENKSTLSLLFATLTGFATPNPFVCHSYTKSPGWVSVAARPLPKAEQSLQFFALFCSPQKTYLPSFQANPRSFCKTPGVGCPSRFSLHARFMAFAVDASPSANARPENLSRIAGLGIQTTPLFHFPARPATLTPALPKRPIASGKTSTLILEGT